MNQQQKMYFILGLCFIPVGITYWLVCYFLMPEVNMPHALFIMLGGFIVAAIGMFIKRDK